VATRLAQRHETALRTQVEQTVRHESARDLATARELSPRSDRDPAAGRPGE